jgi:hypothetical protein
MKRSELEADRTREGGRAFRGDPRANGADARHAHDWRVRS